MNTLIALLLPIAFAASATTSEQRNLRTLKAIHAYGKLVGAEVTGIQCYERITKMSAGLTEWCNSGVCVPVHTSAYRAAGSPPDISICDFNVGAVTGCSGGPSGLVSCPNGQDAAVGVPLETNVIMTQAEWVNWNLQHHPPKIAKTSSHGSSHIQHLGVCSSIESRRGCQSMTVPGYMGFTRAVCLCH